MKETSNLPPNEFQAANEPQNDEKTVSDEESGSADGFIAMLRERVALTHARTIGGHGDFVTGGTIGGEEKEEKEEKNSRISVSIHRACVRACVREEAEEDTSRLTEIPEFFLRFNESFLCQIPKEWRIPVERWLWFCDETRPAAVVSVYQRLKEVANSPLEAMMCVGEAIRHRWKQIYPLSNKQKKKDDYESRWNAYKNKG